jgi:transposase
MMGWTPPHLFGIKVPAGVGVVRVPAQDTKESAMNATSLARSAQSGAEVIVGVDLAKNVFQLCVADAASWRPIESHRLGRIQFERWFTNRAVRLVVMEACGSAHHWARWLHNLGIEAVLLPPKHVRAYVKRNKTDAADAAALLEAARCADLHPVRIKSIEQQALQALHRTRSLWQADRTRRINTLRGYCREFGISIAVGARIGVEQIARVVAEPNSAIPALLRPTMKLLIEEVRLLEARIGALERELSELVRHSPACTTLLSIPGIGLLTSTAMVAATSGDVTHFRDARHFASWFGLTPKESSSAERRRLGGISKRGDAYLRTLLTHGARAVLRAAHAAAAAGKPLDALRAWAVQLQQRTNHNKAACALANKLARICYACLRDHASYGQPTRVNSKTTRQTFGFDAASSPTTA